MRALLPAIRGLQAGWGAHAAALQHIAQCSSITGGWASSSCCCSSRQQPARCSAAAPRSVQQQQQQQQPLLQQPAPWCWSSGRRASTAAADDAKPPPPGSLASNARQSRQRRMILQHEFRATTLGLVIEPYTRRPSLMAAGVLPHPRRTYEYLKVSVQGQLRTWAAVGMAARNIPGFEKEGLSASIASMYRDISRAQAAYELDPIRDMVSKDLFKKLQLQAVQRRQGGWDRIVWALEDVDDFLANKGKAIRLVQGRVQKSDQHSPLEWVQLTYRIRSRQRFAAYRRRGAAQELVAGDPDAVIDVEDHWVFEHKTRVPGERGKQEVEKARWRLVGRLTV